MYTSNEYIVFNPDIVYREGYPGESAYNCIMPGISMLIEKGFVDEKKIGASGAQLGWLSDCLSRNKNLSVCSY